MTEPTLKSFGAEVNKRIGEIRETLDALRKQGSQIPLETVLKGIEAVPGSEWFMVGTLDKTNQPYQTHAIDGMTVTIDRKAASLSLGYSQFINFEGAEIEDTYRHVEDNTRVI